MGNNLITSGGAVAIITAVNNTDNCEVEELDLTVRMISSIHYQGNSNNICNIAFILDVEHTVFKFTVHYKTFIGSPVREQVRNRVP